MEINKLIGYTEIETTDGVLGLKIGAYTLEKLCDNFGISLEQIDELMDFRETDIDGQMFVYQVPKNPIKFLASILHNGVNYVSLHTDGKEYPLARAYDWIDQIGWASKKSQQILATFLHAARTGVVGPMDEQPEDPKTRKKKAPDVVEAA